MLDENSNSNHGIQDIEVSSKRREFNDMEKVGRDISYKKKNQKIWPKLLLLVLATAIVFFFLSWFLHSATITVKSKTERLIFDSDVYTAIPTRTTAIETTEPALIKKPSIGKIKITNKMSTTQKLRKETRFQTGDLVYKIFSSVNIPSNSSIIAEAFSVESGNKYNIKKDTELLITGFKEENMIDEYEKITGKAYVDFLETNTREEIASGSQSSSENILGSVKYEIINIDKTAEKEIDSLGVSETKEKAVGKIKITNKMSTTQKLRKETRFEVDGLIFKTYKSVTIPSNSSVVVKAFADEFGPSHNIISGKSMTIPGFKEGKMTTEFAKITGKTETAFIGGVLGKENIPNADQLEDAKKDLKDKILKEIENEKNKITADRRLVVDAGNEIEAKFTTTSKGDKVVVSASANLKIPVIQKNEFIEMVLDTQEIEKEDLDTLDIKDFSGLNVRILNKDGFSLNSADEFNFILSGEVNISWVLDRDSFIKLSKGNSFDQVKKSLESSFKNFEFKMEVAPFWRKSIPDNIDKIKLIIE